MQTSIIFVGGAGRSGKSLLQSVLCSSPDTHPVVAECQYLNSQLTLYRHWSRNLDPFILSYFDDVDAFRRYTQRLVQEFIDVARARLAPRKALVLKNPELTRFFPDLAAFLPDARFLVSVRHPKDTIADMLAVTQRQLQSNQTAYLGGFGRDMARFCAHYKSFYTPLAETNDQAPNFRERTLFVKYEDLVLETDKVVPVLASFCGIRLDRFDRSARWNTLVDYEVRKRDKILGPWTTQLYGEAVSDADIGSYRRILTADEASTIDSCCADIYRSFGYGTAPGPGSPGQWWATPADPHP